MNARECCHTVFSKYLECIYHFSYFSDMESDEEYDYEAELTEMVIDARSRSPSPDPEPTLKILDDYLPNKNL